MIIRNKGLTRKLLISFFITILLSQAIIYTVYVRNLSNLLIERSLKEEEQYLKQLSTFFSLFLKETINSVFLFSQSKVFTDYFYNLDRFNYEEFLYNHGSYPETDKQKYYDFISQRAAVFKRLEQMSLYNDFLDSIYIFDPNTMEVFSSQDVPEMINSFYDKSWYYDLSVIPIQTPYSLGLREIPPNSLHKTRSVITIVLKISDEKVPFIINIDAGNFYKMLIENLNWNDEMTFFLLSEEEELLLYDYSDMELIKLVLADSIPDAFILNSIELEYYPWTFYGLVDNRSIKKQLVTTSIYLAFISLGSVFLALLILFRYLQKVSQPIQEMMTILGTNSRDDDELELIKQYVIQSEYNQKSTEALESRSKLIITEHFLQAILMDKSIPKETFDKMLSQCDIKFSTSIIIFYIRVIPIQKDPRGSYEALKKELVQMLENIFPEDALLVPLKGLDNCIVLREYDVSESIIFSSQILNVKTQFHLLGQSDLYISFSRPFDDIYSISSEFEKVSKKIDYLLLPDCSRLMNPDDYNNSYPFWFFNETVTESVGRMKQNLRAGEKDQFKSELISLLNSMNSQDSPCIQASHIRYLYSSIFGQILSVFQEHNLSGIEYYDFYTNLGAAQTYEEIMSIFDFLAKEIISSFEKVGSQGDSTEFFNRVKKYIKEKDSPFFNLKEISSDFNMNTSYFSQKFHKSTGMKFTSFLKEFRVTRARELLNSTEFTIKEIGYRVGYWNSNYFIKVFKEETGMTPGAFRRISSQNWDRLEDK